MILCTDEQVMFVRWKKNLYVLNGKPCEQFVHVSSVENEVFMFLNGKPYELPKAITCPNSNVNSK